MELTESVGTLAGVIASQAEVIAAQQATINVLSGGKSKSLALEQTIGEMWARYFTTLPDVPWKKSVESTMKPFLAMCGDVKVGDFGQLHWERYRDAPETKERYRASTKNVQLARVRTMLYWAVTTGQLHENPLQRTKPERGPPKRKTEVSQSDEAAIAGDLNPLMRVMFVVALDSAMRRNEVRLMTWSEIDWKTKTVFLAAERTKAKRARTAYLTTRAAEALKTLPKYPGCPFVFANPDTLKPYSETFVWKHFRRAADDNGIKPAAGDISVRWHDLRRTSACRLVRLGAPIPAVQEILGHANLAVTAQYIHAQRQDVLDAHALLDKAMRKGPHRAPPPQRALGARAAGDSR